MGELERRAWRMKITNPGDPDVERMVNPVIAVEQKKRDDNFARDVEAYKAKMDIYKQETQTYETFQRERDQRAATLSKTWADVDKEREANKLRANFGGRDPDKVFAELSTQRDEAKQISYQLVQNRLAIKAINEGVITGYGANFRIDMARLASFAANNGLSSDAAANTQILRAALSAAIGQSVRNIQGGSTAQVSNTDRILAEKASGADPTLEIGAIRQILSTSNRLASEKIDDFEDRRDYYLKDTRAHRDYVIPSTETAPAPFIEKLVSNPSKENRDAFDTRFGSGSAQLEINRHKRRAR